MRGVEDVRCAPRPGWIGDGFLIHRYVAREAALVRKVSPFLRLDYHAPFVYPPTWFRRGLPPHTHRGIATVTIAFAGRLAHHDSTGAGGTIDPGDVHWMSAGRGIRHEEYHEPGFAGVGGSMHMLQIWVNSPACEKTSAPRYQLMQAGSIPAATLARAGGFVRVIAGSHAGVSGIATTITPLSILDVTLHDGGAFSLDSDASHNLCALVIGGSVRINGERTVERGNFVVFDHHGRTTTFVGQQSQTRLIVLCGAPLDGPLA